MIKDGKILLGKAGEKEVVLLPQQLNRHGLIAGASGTGKTVTMKVVIEGLSQLGVPTFLADVKGDLTGMIVEGDKAGIQERLDSMGIEEFNTMSFPVHLLDVYREQGIPVRLNLQEVTPELLSRILELTEAQEGVLHIVYKCAEDMDLGLYDLKDLQAMVQYVGEHTSELTVKYGNISKQTVGAIQRKLLQLESQKGELLFGVPELELSDILQVKDGLGVMSILECSELFQHPLMYSTIMLWMLNRLYNEMPEVGDLDKPKAVFFFDEAHLLFNNCSKSLLDQILRIVKLIRSKGVGIFFISQQPSDIPDEVLAQLSNRIQHALRAYTPAEIKNVKTAADSFRPNPEFKTEDVITNMKTGYALVSVLDETGAPTIVEKTKILPPQSSMNIASQLEREGCYEEDALYAKYSEDQDPESAYEKMEGVYQAEAEAKAEEEEKKKEAKVQEAKEKAEAREQAKKEAQGNKLAKKIVNKVENEIVNSGAKIAKKAAKNFFKNLIK